jgi:hypothetical protein
MQILAVSVGVAGLALGIGIPVFYETQVKGSVSNSQLTIDFVVISLRRY